MASLAEALYAMPSERLRGLIQTRAIDSKRLALIPDKQTLVQFLSSELSNPQSIVAAVLQCNVRALRLLQMLIAQEIGKILPWKEMLELAGGAGLEEALTEVIMRLEDLGLAFRVGGGVYVPDSVRYQVPASLADRHSLLRLLPAYDAPTLKRICDNLGLPADTKNVNVDRIRAHLLKEPTLNEVKKRLDREEIEVLETLLQAGGAASPIEVATEVASVKTEDFFRYDWQTRWKQGREKNAIDRLLGKGLIYVVPDGYGFNLFLVIPGDLLRALTGAANSRFWTEPPPTPMPLASAPPVTIRHSTIIRDVVALLGFVSMQETVRTNTGHMHKTSLKNAARLLSVPTDRYASFLYAVCREAELIAPQGEKQTYALTSQGNSWLHWDELAQMRALFGAWRDGAIWGEMYNDALQKNNDYRQRQNVVIMRQAALRLLIAAGSDGFIDVDSLTDALVFQSPLLLAPTNYGPTLVSSPAAFMKMLIGECLLWLGLVEIGLRETPAPDTMETSAARRGVGVRGRGEPAERAATPEIVGFQFTPLGAYLLGRANAAVPETLPREDQFIVQANTEIFIPPYLAPATLYRLLTITDPPGKTAAGNTVSLTRDALRRALDSGQTPRDIVEFLRAHARTGIPQNVEYLINEVGGKHGHIHIGKAQMYLRVDTPLLMKELQTRRELKAYFVRNLSDTVAVLNAEDPEKLLRELRKAGYLPVSDDASRSSAFQDQVQHAPPAVAPVESGTPTKAAQRTARAAATLDWERIAREDGQPWKAGKAIAAPPAGIPMARDKASIRRLLMEACGTLDDIQIGYRSEDGRSVETTFIQPEDVAGNLVYSIDEESGHEKIYYLNRILWAARVD